MSDVTLCRECGWHGGFSPNYCGRQQNIPLMQARAKCQGAWWSRDRQTFERLPPPLVINYRNYRGEEAVRQIVPRRVWFGSTEHHPEPQWLLDAFDLEKQADRTFAMRDFGAAST